MKKIEPKEKVLIRRDELFDMQRAIKLMNGIISSELGNHRAKLRRQVDSAIEDMQDFLKTDEWKRITNLYKDTEKEFAKLDKFGSPERSNTGSYIIPTENVPLLEEKLSIIREKEKENIAKRNQIWENYIQSLEDMIDISNFERIPNSLFDRIDVATEVKDWLWPIIDKEK